MILTILKWIGIGLLIWFALRFLKSIFLILLYKFNKNYKNYVDYENAKVTIQEAAERQKEEEEKKQNSLAMYISLWSQTAQYYYYYYEKGVLMTDYAFMLDLLTQRIITLLGGDYKAFRNQVTELLKGKDIKDGRIPEIKDKGIPPIPKDIKLGDFEKRNFTDDDINKILDEWEKKHKKNTENDKSEETK